MVPMRRTATPRTPSIFKGNLNDADRATLATYTQGVKEADDSLKMLDRLGQEA